jgi:hypothetical protein
MWLCVDCHVLSGKTRCHWLDALFTTGHYRVSGLFQYKLDWLLSGNFDGSFQPSKVTHPDPKPTWRLKASDASRSPLRQGDWVM